MHTLRAEKGKGGLINDKGSFSDFGRNRSSQGQQRVPARGRQDLAQQRMAPFSKHELRPASQLSRHGFPGPLWNSHLPGIELVLPFCLPQEMCGQSQ